ncbi:DUF7331 family protein [Halapricum salinum]|nr:hypothetical protein [Halapricum salinum]
MPASETPARDEQRYAELSLEDGSIVIYDAENSSAWIQSDATVAAASIA